MKVSCIQMNVRVSMPEENFSRAEALLKKAAKKKPDVILLPELWNTGFAPRFIDLSDADEDGARTKALCGGIAKEYGVNIVAGSVLTRKEGALYNTAYVFDRAGSCITEYDKTHLFSPMGEGNDHRRGNALGLFSLDGITCGVLICYDLRFPEFSRTLALSGAKIFFIPAEWPRQRTEQMIALLRARAIENQVFVALTNGCGSALSVHYGGKSAIVDPLGNILARAGRSEKIITASLNFDAQDRIRRELPVFSDRRPSLYSSLCEPIKK